MWRSATAALLGLASVCFGFRAPLARRTQSSPATGRWLSLASSTLLSKREHTALSRCRRRRTCTMAGPNRGQKPSFFANWPVLEAEIKTYLAEREDRLPPASTDSPSRLNPVLSILSLDPAQMTRADAEADKWEGETDVLAYSELARAARRLSYLAMSDESWHRRPCPRTLLAPSLPMTARVYLVGGKGRQPPQVEHEQFDNSCFSVGQEKLFQQPKHGYGYLVEPIMNMGGYAEASARLGIALNERILKDKAYYERRNPPVGLKKQSSDGILTLGRARDERLDSAADVDRQARRKALFDKQAMMDKDLAAVVATMKDGEPSAINTPAGGASGAGQADEVFRPPGLPDAKNLWTLPDNADRGPPQPLVLSPPQRAYIVALAGCTALAFGRGTADALEAGLLPPDVPEVAMPICLLLVGMNLASAAAGGAIARSKGRSVLLWAFKGALAGLTSVLELKRLPAISLQVQSRETAQVTPDQ